MEWICLDKYEVPACQFIFAKESHVGRVEDYDGVSWARLAQSELIEKINSEESKEFAFYSFR